MNSDFPLLLVTRIADALLESLQDPVTIRKRVAETENHAKNFPEVRFCKGCVLPVVDKVSTSLLQAELFLSPREIYQSLLCEGQSTLGSIYKPGEGQSGFGGYTWGENYQRFDKAGNVAP